MNRRATWLRGTGLLLVSLIVMGTASVGYAGVNLWTTVGPPDDPQPSVEVDGIAVDPNTPSTMYVGSDSVGFFKSTDSGVSWQLTNNAIVSTFGGNLVPIAIDPNFSTTLYAGGYVGLFTSTDAGLTWNDITDNLPIDTDNVVDISAAATVPTTVYAVMSGGGVYKRTIGASSWTEIDSQIPDSTVDLALSQQRPNTLYAATASSGVFKSTDGGASWNDTTNDLDDTSTSAIVTVPTNANVIYVATFSGIYASNNGGAHWAAAADLGAFGTSILLALYPSATPTLYVATDQGELFVSTTGGTKWSEIDQDLPSSTILSLATQPGAAGTIYVGTDLALSKSTDTGSTWQDLSFGLSSAYVYAMTINPGAANTILTVTDTSLFKTTDGGTSWVDTGLTASLAVLTTDPTHPNRVFAGGQSLFGSTDSGSTWNDLMPNPALTFTAVAVDPTNSNTIYAGTNGSGVEVSTDGGANFSPANNGLPVGYVAPLEVARTTPPTIYAAPDFGMFRSTDGTASWAETDAGLPDNSYVFDFALEPVPSTSIYAVAYDTSGTLDGLFKSTDNGDHWTILDQTLHEPLATDPSHAGTAYAVGDEGIVRSTDGGSTWLRLGLGNNTITLLAVDPTNSAKIYAGTDSLGIQGIELTAAFVTPTPINQPSGTPATPTPTATSGSGATPTPTLGQSTCVGDCDGRGTVTVDELVIGVNIALGNQSVTLCPAFDHDHNNRVTVDELVLGVNNALNGCPAT